MDPMHTAATVTGLVAAATAVGVVGRFVLRMGRNVTDLHDDWKGEPDRPGVPGRPGVMARLAAVESGLAGVTKELHPNGGSSMRDALARVESRVDDLAARLDARQPVQVNVGVQPAANTEIGASRNV